MMGPVNEEERATRIWTGLTTVFWHLEDRRREVALALDMSFARARALRRLARGPMTMRELAHKLVSDAPYVTLMVDDLESRGYLTRTVNPDDKRTKILTITPAGAEAAARAQEILDRPPKALLSLPADDLATLDRIVATLLH